MTPWIIFALLAAAVLAALAWPLLVRAPERAGRARQARAVFQDQLAELDRDLGRGLIAPPEAEAARNEIARRLLAAREEEPTAPARRSRWPGLAALALVPALAIGLYGAVGRPDLPDVPRQQRLAAALERQDMPALIARVEDHLAGNPDDVQGWAVLAPSYRDMGRYGDAAEAYAHLLRLEPATAQRLADYAEMAILAGGGLITGEARKALDEALALDPKQAKARYYGGLALKQENRADEALSAWRALLSDSPTDAPWRRQLEADIAALQAPGPSAEQVAAAAEMKPEERQAMIRGMVEGLEQKLKENGADAEGWRRLIRARMVLGEPDKARDAYAAARDAFKDKPEALAAFEGLARELGVK